MGKPCDDAQAKAGWSTLKMKPLLCGGAFASPEEAKLEVTYHFDTYSNLDRRHSALSYRLLCQFEPNF